MTLAVIVQGRASRNHSNESRTAISIAGSGSRQIEAHGVRSPFLRLCEHLLDQRAAQLGSAVGPWLQSAVAGGAG